MGFVSLFLVASMPIIQVLLIGVVEAYLASGFSNLLTTSAPRDMNKVVFTVFTPSLMFASLAKMVTLEDVISWRVASPHFQSLEEGNAARVVTASLHFYFSVTAEMIGGILFSRWFMPVNIAITFMIVAFWVG